MATQPRQASEGSGGAERRRWPRANCDLPVTITIDGARHEARLRDISRAGVCFYLERPLPLMTVLGLALDLEVGGKRHALRAQGAVVRCQKISPSLQHYEIALFLHAISDSDRALLDAHVRTGVAV